MLLFVSWFSWYKEIWRSWQQKHVFIAVAGNCYAQRTATTHSLWLPFVKRTLFTFGNSLLFWHPHTTTGALCSRLHGREKSRLHTHRSGRRSPFCCSCLPLLRIKQLDARAKNRLLLWPDRICMKLNEEEKDFVCFPPSSHSGSLFSARCKSNLAPVRLLPANEKSVDKVFN